MHHLFSWQLLFDRRLQGIPTATGASSVLHEHGVIRIIQIIF